MSSLTKEELLFMAKVCEEVQKFKEMLFYIKQAILQTPGNEPTIEERNLLIVAFQNIVGEKRASWRAASGLEQKELLKGHPNANLIIQLRKTVEAELKEICYDCSTFVETSILPTCNTAQSRVFFNKMRGDYYRYLAEFLTGNEKGEVTEKGLAAYEEATGIAEAELSVTDPIRLGLVLNFSVFYYEILNNVPRSQEIAKKAFDDAIVKIDELNEEDYKDTTMIMQLLRDGLTLWATDFEEEKPEQAEQSN